ncbi:MAG: hypothetical protein ACI9GC_001500, partial [Phycisphaerales bacterium]
GGFQGNDITLGQRDPELYKTTLACSGNQFHVVVTTENNASIDGFTITGGNAVGTSGARFNGGGILIGGALFTDSHSPLGDLTIVNRCSFTKNYISIDSGDPYSMGGAAIKIAFSTDAVITNSLFTGNFSNIRGEGGGLQIRADYNFPPQVSDTMTILNAAGGIEETFESIWSLGVLELTKFRLYP